MFRANRRPHLKWRVPGILTVLEVHHRMRHSEARLFGGQVDIHNAQSTEVPRLIADGWSATAFIADNISLIPANNAIQAAAAVQIAKVRMREGCFNGAFEPRPVTDRAIARPGEWSKVTITVSAARIIAVAQRDASTLRRR